MDKSCATARLAQDTLGLLRADTPVLARTETLRRAALYATGSSKAEDELMRGLVERAKSHPDDALAWFDVGSLAEAGRQANGENEPAFWSRLLETLHVRPAKAEVSGRAGRVRVHRQGARARAEQSGDGVRGRARDLVPAPRRARTAPRPGRGGSLRRFAARKEPAQEFRRPRTDAGRAPGQRLDEPPPSGAGDRAAVIL